MSLLLVEDDEDARELMVELFESVGYAIRAVASARSALEALSEDESIELVILDLVLPGISGWELSVELAERWPRLPVVVCTGLPRQVPPNAALLVKPFDLDDALAVVARQLQVRAVAR